AGAVRTAQHLAGPRGVFVTPRRPVPNAVPGRRGRARSFFSSNYDAKSLRIEPRPCERRLGRRGPGPTLFADPPPPQADRPVLVPAGQERPRSDRPGRGRRLPASWRGGPGSASRPAAPPRPGLGRRPGLALPGRGPQRGPASAALVVRSGRRRGG